MEVIHEKLLELMTLVSRAERGDLEAAAEAFELVHGTATNRDIPFGDRIDPLWHFLPKVEAWCVVKDDSYRPGSLTQERVWPGQAYADQETAEAWREFLEDFYFDEHVRDGLVVWRVEHLEVHPREVARGRRRPRAGQGYYQDRHGWVGTLPMRKFEWNAESRTWVRKETA